MMLERYDEAADWAAKATAVPNATFWAYAQLVAAHTRGGHAEAAKEAAVQLLAKEPEFSSRRFAEQFLFYHHDKSSIDWYSKILLSAGLPE